MVVMWLKETVEWVLSKERMRVDSVSLALKAKQSLAKFGPYWRLLASNAT